MIVHGKYNKAKIYTDVIEDTAKKQIAALCNDPAFKDTKIRIMPDVHAGAGCTIGTTMTIKDKIVPNMVGVDIGCGMELAKLKERVIDFKALDELIRSKIPAGMTSRKTVHPYASQIDLKQLRCYAHINASLAHHSIGTLGGGNHFIEVDEDDEDSKYLVIHSGSRHLGLEVAGYYQTAAYKNLCNAQAGQITKAINKLKKAGKTHKIQSTIAKLKEKQSPINPDTAYAYGQLFDDYIHDMKIIQQFATINRKAMMHEIVTGLNLTVIDGFTTIHNYVDTDEMILRKGAVSAKKGKRLLIPLNMRDGSLICIGKGNADWNESAPHGAGRLISRAKAFATLSMEEFKREMSGIYSTSICKQTLDESPMAYNGIDDILDNITPTVSVVKRILPVYNFKASEDDPHTRKKKKRT